MIQELLAEAATGLIRPAERSKLSVPSGVSPSPSPSQSPSPPPSTTTTPTNSSSTSENLRCPRCDSTNTKFCYYNNYNLTQPRHFCKTCRRYWTKGGALRNVPIGGGCRKNRATTITSAAAAAKSNNSAVKLKPMSAELGKSSSFISSCFEHEISSNPILFASPHQNSHLLSLLRANSNPNPNPNTSQFSNSATIKDEPLLFQSHMGSLDSPVPGTALNARILGLDPLGPVSSSVWGNSQQQQQNGFNFNIGELQSSGLQDFYQRLRSSTNYYQDHASEVVGKVTAASTSSAILESAPVVGATELGYWNPVLSWSDLPTTHGAYQ